MNATHETDASAPSMTGMSASASWFIDQTTALSDQAVMRFEQDFRTSLTQLIPQIEKLAAARPEDDVPAQVALAAAGEARRRLDESEAASLRGEGERVKRLARSVMALSQHHDALTGTTFCVVCDQVIEDGDESVPHDYGDPSGGGPVGPRPRPARPPGAPPLICDRPAPA